MSSQAAQPREDRVLLVAAAGLLVALVLRCITPMDPFPYWSGDPMLQAAPVLGLTPARALCVDALTLAATCIVALRTARTTPWPMHAAFGVLAGVAGVVYWHARATAPDGVDAAVQGWGWVSALCGAWALANCAVHHAAARALIVASLSAVTLLLVVRGGVQVFVEHPQSMASFRQSRDAFFAAQGWTSDSPMAKAFVRRMEQPEASAWFGYANVFATLVAGGAALLGALAWHARTQRASRSTLLALTLGAIACVVGVALAGSKGGYAALALGGVLCVAAPWLFRRLQPAAIIGVALIAAVQGAIVLRGLVGERVHELSVLFRWFYMQAAVRIAGDHPLLGVGPSGSAFKDAYLLAKNPRSPEEVASPHNLPLDWMTSLGVAGFSLTLLWLVSIAAASRASVPAQPALPQRRFELRDTSSLFMLICVIATLIAALLEREGLIAETAAVRLGGCVGAVTVGRCILMLLEQDEASAWVRRGLTAAALCTAAQCCIELTGVTIGAGAWCFTLLATTATLCVRPSPTAKRSLWRLATPLLALALVVGVCMSTVSIWRWEARLKDAYAVVAPSREFRERLTSPAPSDSLESIARDLALATGARVAPTPDDVQRATIALAAATASQAASRLEEAIAVAPGHFGVLRALVRLRLGEAAAQSQLGNAPQSAARAGDALAALDRHESRFAQKSQYWVLRGGVLEAMIPPEAASGPHPLRELALAACDRASQLSPHEWQVTLRLSDLAAAQGAPEAAARWAERSLEQQDALGLDPIKQIPPQPRARLEGRVRR